MTIKKNFDSYFRKLSEGIKLINFDYVDILYHNLRDSIGTQKNVFIFGNGGSAANAMHIANDFIYGISKEFGNAVRINALSSNQSVLTCLANDIGYESIFVNQLAVLASPGDIAIALSGSGNSPNVVKAIEWANDNKLITFAILGFDGGELKNIAQNPIHLPVNDMQMSEDSQLIICHMIMQEIFEHLAVEKQS